MEAMSIAATRIMAKRQHMTVMTAVRRRPRTFRRRMTKGRMRTSCSRPSSPCPRCSRAHSMCPQEEESLCAPPSPGPSMRPCRFQRCRSQCSPLCARVCGFGPGEDQKAPKDCHDAYDYGCAADCKDCPLSVSAACRGCTPAHGPGGGVLARIHGFPCIRNQIPVYSVN